MKDVQSCGFGDAWKKPIERRMSRIVDYWQISQPLHLRHLAIIRDTALVGKSPHYVHYTYENFKSLVDKGAASWDAVATNSYGAKNNGKLTIPLPGAEADLDEYGFPRLSPHDFQGAEDGATLAECVHAFMPQPLPLDKHGNVVGGEPSKYERKIMEDYWNVKTGIWNDRKRCRAIRQKDFTTDSVKIRGTCVEQQTPKIRRVQKQYEGKKRGRPRKVQTIGLPDDFDKLSNKKKNHILRLQRSAIRYASRQVEKQIALRVAEGIDMIEARELVLAEVDAQYIRSEQRPISDAIRPYIGLSQAPPTQHYLPSIAAHTLQNFSRQEPVDELEASQGQSRGSQRPHSHEQVDGDILDNPPVVPARATRGRPRKKLAVPEVPYFPSMAAHTLPIWKLDSATNPRKIQSKNRRDSRNVTYLPSVAAHTFPYYERGVSTKISKNRKRKLSPLVRLPTKRFRYRSRESFYTELSETTQSASNSGLYLSAKERDPSRRGQPLARLAIFVLRRLVQLPWFVPEKTSINHDDAGRDDTSPYAQEAQSNLQQRINSSDRHSPGQAQISRATDTATKTGVVPHGEALDAANERTRIDLTISQESEQDALMTDVSSAKHYERRVASEPPTVVTGSCTAGDLNTDRAQLPQRSVDSVGPPRDEALSNTHRESLPQIVVDPPSQQKSKKTAGGSIAMLRKSIILDLLSRCGGVIPGDKALDAPFVVEWNKRGQTGQPDKETVRKTVEALCVAGKVRKLRFSFTNAKGVTITKSMVTSTDLSATDPRVLETQRAIISFDPVCYYPEVLDTPVEWDRRAYSGWRRELEFDENTVCLQNKPAYVEKYEQGKRALDERRVLKKGLIATKRAAYEEGQRERQTHAKRLTNSLIDAAEALRQAGHLGQEAFNVDEVHAKKHSKLIREFKAALRALSSAQNDGQPSGPDTINTTVEEQIYMIRRCYVALKALAPTGFLDDLGFPTSIVDLSGRAGRRSAPSLSGRAVQPQKMSSGLLKSTSKPRKVQRLESLRSPTFPEPSRQPAAPVLNYCDTEPAVELRFRFLEGSLRPLAPSVWAAADREEYDWANEEGVTTESALPNPTLEPPPWAILDLRTINAGSRGYDALHNSLESVVSSHADGFIQNHFIHDVDALQRWEVENIESPSAFPGWPFVNHVMDCAHTKTDFPSIDMNATSYHYLKNGQKGNFVSKAIPGPSSNPVREVRETSRETSETFKVSRQSCDILPKLSEGSFGILMPSNTALPWKYQNRISVNYDGDMDMTSQKVPSLKRKRKSSPAGLKRRRLSRPVKIVSLGPEAGDFQKITYRGPRKVRIFGEENEKRLLVAVVVMRVIAGGLDQRMDWILVAKIFEPEYDEMFIHSLWPGIRQKYRAQIDKLTSDFQAMFPKAYEERLVPPLDFDHLDEYPWAKLVDWTMENMDVPVHMSTLELPATRSEFDKSFSLKDCSDVSFAHFFDTTYENTIARRQGIQSKQAFVCPVRCEPSGSKEDEPSELEIIKSHIRANVLTPDNRYKATAALARLSSFDKKLMGRAVQQLLSDRILIGQKEGRLLPGRNYKLSKTCFDALKKYPTPETLQRAATFKRHLDRLLLHLNQADGTSSRQSFISNSLDKNEHAVVILNLAAHGRITLRPHDAPKNKFGILSQPDHINYETRKMDKKSLFFSVEVTATEKYVEGNPLLPLPAAPAPHLLPPSNAPASAEQEIAAGRKERRIPFWYSIHDRLIPKQWAVARAAVLSQMVLRPGIREAEIAKRVSPALGTWDVGLVLAWLRQAGVAEKIGEGWNTKEWWWAGLDIGDGDADGDGSESDETEVEEETVNEDEDEDEEMEDAVPAEKQQRRVEEDVDGVGTSTDDARVEELIMQGA